MRFGYVLIFLRCIFYAHSWKLRIHPRDIYLPKNATLNATCEINKAASIQRDEVFFRFLIDGNYGGSEYEIVQVTKDYMNYIDNYNINIKYNVNSPTYQNSLLICEAGEERAEALVTLGDYPHNVTDVSCYIKDWDDMICEVTYSGLNTIWATNYIYQLYNRYNKTVASVVPKSKPIVIKNILRVFSLDDVLTMRLQGENQLGKGHPYDLEVKVSDLVRPDAGQLRLEARGARNKSATLLLSSLRLNREYSIFLEVNCSDVPSVYKMEFESEGRRVGRDVVFELPEDDLPVSRECQASGEVKPLGYGTRSHPGNVVFFNTRDKVPLSNPEVFNSSFEVLSCNSDMLCDVNVYFKPLSKEESRGIVSEYRVTVTRKDRILHVGHRPNLGLPFVNVSGLQMLPGDGEDFLVTVEAATAAGYNATLEATPLVVNGSVDYYSPLFPRLSNGSNRPVGARAAGVDLYLVAVDDGHVDIVTLADDGGHVRNVYIVWCPCNRSTGLCRDEFGWLKVADPRETLTFVVPPGGALGDYAFGVHVGSGLKWLESQCYFVTRDSKPMKPSLKGTTFSNQTHLLFYIERPLCFKDEKVNLPRGYVVEYSHVQKMDNVSKRFNFSDNLIVLGNLEPGAYHISVFALAWRNGPSSDRLTFAHSVPKPNDSKAMTLWVLVGLVLVVVTILGLCATRLVKKLCRETVLKIQTPNKQFNTDEDYSNLNSKGTSSGYKVCPEEDVDIKSKNVLHIELQMDSNFESKKCPDTGFASSGDYSSGSNNYAVTKLVDKPISSSGDFSENPSKIVPEVYGELPSGTESSTSLEENRLLVKMDSGDGRVTCDKNDASFHSSLVDYPPIKILIDPLLCNNPENIVLLEETSVTESQDGGLPWNSVESEPSDEQCHADREDDGGAISCSESSEDEYCKMSNFKNVNVFALQA